MKKLSFVLIICILLSISANVFAAEADTAEWFTWNMPDEEKAIGTAIDVSGMLDAPAGKHGFVRAQGEYIIFEDGTSARFWGTNVGVDSVFDDYDRLDELAMRIARSGYNLVRLHALDINPSGKGNNIFGEKYGTDTTKRLDGEQLDRLFYFISKLKEKGVYIYMDLMAYRMILPMDGIEDTGGAMMCAESNFSEQMIDLQKLYAKQLLTEINPYTGIALKDDPAIVFMAINNENGITELTEGVYRNEEAYKKEYYANILNDKFNGWLKNKYTAHANLSAAWGQPVNGNLDGGSVVFDYKYAKSTDYTDEAKKDMDRFVYYLQGEMYKTMVDYLKNTLGVKCLVTGTTLGLGAQNAVTMAACDEFTDYVDNHSYNSHPTNWFDNGSTFQGMGSSAGYGVNMFWRAGYYRTQKPYVISEYQECIPNEYGAETEPMMAVIASFQNWYPLNYCMRADGQTVNYLYDAFQTYNSPARTAVQPSSAMIYHRKDVKEAGMSLEIPAIRDNIITKTYAEWPETSKIQYGLFTDYAKARYVLMDKDEYDSYDKSEFNAADTILKKKIKNKETVINDQIVWERDNSLIKVTTDKSNLVTGNTKNVSYESDAMTISIKNDISTITLVSLDDKKLSESGHMLLTAAAREKNTGMTFDENNSGHMLTKGNAPILTEAVNASVTIKTNSDIAVFALDSSGRKAQAVETTRTSGGYTFKPNGKYKTLYYEIQKKSGKTLFTDISGNELRIFGYGSGMSEADIYDLDGTHIRKVYLESNNGIYFGKTEPDLENGTYTVVSGGETAEFDYNTKEYKAVNADESPYYTDCTPAGGFTVINKDGGLPGNVSELYKFGKTENGVYTSEQYPMEFRFDGYRISGTAIGNMYLKFNVGTEENYVYLYIRNKYDTHYLKAEIVDGAVNIPFSELGISDDAEICAIGFTEKNKKLYINNMYIGTGIEIIGDYYCNDEKAVNIINDGAYAQGVVFVADTSVSNYAKVTRDYVLDGEKCIKVDFREAGKAVKFGHNKNKLFSGITAGSNIIARIKLSVINTKLSLVKTESKFTGGVVSVCDISEHIKNTTEWQTIKIPIDESISDSFGLGFTVASGTAPEMYIQYLAVAPADAEIYNRLTKERKLYDICSIFENGRFNCQYEKYPPNAGSGPYINVTDKILITTLGKQGLLFNTNELGITDENFRKRYLKLKLQAEKVNDYLITFGRTDGTKTDSFTVKYESGEQTILIPLSSLVIHEDFSWDDTDKIFIRFDESEWWRQIDIYSISIGELFAGEVRETETIVQKDTPDVPDTVITENLKDIFRNGNLYCDYKKYPENASQGPYATVSNIIYFTACGKQGLSFSLSELGITDKTSKDAFLNIELKNMNTSVYDLSVGLIGADSITTVNYGQGRTTVRIPLDLLSGWDNATDLFIRFNDTMWWRNYEIYNIWIDKDVMISAPKFVTMEKKLVNTMDSSYEYKAKENIFTVTDDKLKNIISVHEDTHVLGKNTVKVIFSKTIEAQPGNTVTWYLWDNLSDIMPCRDKKEQKIKP